LERPVGDEECREERPAERRAPARRVRRAGGGLWSPGVRADEGQVWVWGERVTNEQASEVALYSTVYKIGRSTDLIIYCLINLNKLELCANSLRWRHCRVFS